MHLDTKSNTAYAAPNDELQSPTIDNNNPDIILRSMWPEMLVVAIVVEKFCVLPCIYVDVE